MKPIRTKPLRSFLRLAVALALTASINSSASAGPTSQIGGIEFDVSKNDTSPAEVQDQAIGLLEEFTKSKTLPEFNANHINYLNSVYLYCTLNKGTCSLPLDALLEIDVARSQKGGKAECPTLTKFWTSWLKNGFEEKQSYNVKTAFLSVATQFSNSERPKYIQCLSTVTKILEAGSAPSGSRAQEFLEFLKAIKASNVNVFSTGTTPQKGVDAKKN